MLVERLISCCKEVRGHPHRHPFSPRFRQKRKKKPLSFGFVYVNSVVLSDRDRTFAAQCRAHAALIHLASRRVGEEGEQGREDGSRRGDEWGELVVVLDAETSSPNSNVSYRTHLFFYRPTWNNEFRSRKHTVHHLRKASITSHAVSWYCTISPHNPRALVSNPSSFTQKKLAVLLCITLS